MPKSLRHLCIALLAFVACAASAQGHRSTALLHVSLTIMSRVDMQVVTAPRQLAISQADVARGYVDLPEPVTVAVNSNVAQGFALSLTDDGGQVRHAQLRAAGNQPQGAEYAWRVRLHLADGAQAGDAPKPMRLNVVF